MASAEFSRQAWGGKPGMETAVTSEWNEYQLWKALKAKNMRKGFAFGVVNIFTTMVCLRLRNSAPDDQIFILLVIDAVVSYASGIAATVLLCRAKGLGSSWIIVSLICGLSWGVPLLAPDRNVKEVPNKPSTGYKPEGSVFSDW